MAYGYFDPSKPDELTENGSLVCQSTRNNLRAVRDGLIMGAFHNWKVTIVGTDVDAPDYSLYESGVEQIKESYTYRPDGFIESTVYEYSSDSGTTWELIGTLNFTYDSNGFLISAEWS